MYEVVLEISLITIEQAEDRYSGYLIIIGTCFLLVFPYQNVENVETCRNFLNKSYSKDYSKYILIMMKPKRHVLMGK